MRLESLVIVNDYVTVNGTPIFVHTARHVMEIGGVRRTVTGRVDSTLTLKIHTYRFFDLILSTAQLVTGMKS